MKILNLYKYLILMQFGFVITIFTFFYLQAILIISIEQLLLYICGSLIALVLLHQQFKRFKQLQRISIFPTIAVIFITFNLLNLIVGLLTINDIKKYNNKLIN